MLPSVLRSSSGLIHGPSRYSARSTYSSAAEAAYACQRTSIAEPTRVASKRSDSVWVGLSQPIGKAPTSSPHGVIPTRGESLVRVKSFSAALQNQGSIERSEDPASRPNVLAMPLLNQSLQLLKADAEADQFMPYVPFLTLMLFSTARS